MSVQDYMFAAKILVVDDEADNLMIFREYLNSAGYINVTTIANPSDGLALIQKNEFDLILLDIMMPQIDGFEVMAKIKKMEPLKKCQILVLTANQDDDVKIRALNEGAQDFLSKPFLEEELLCRVRNLLNMHFGQEYLRAFNERLNNLVWERTLELEERNTQLLQSQLEVLNKLAVAAEFRDNQTGLHVVRMSHYAQEIGRGIGFNEEDANLLFHTSPMHDVGKIGIPDAILLKTSKLDPDEFAVMKLHTEIGGKILDNGSSEFLQVGRTIALTHHERWDGKGYPKGLKGEEISIFGRIVAVADVFDALTSDRPYKEAWDDERAFEAIREGSGTQFDPKIVNAFFRIQFEILSIKNRYQEQKGVLEND